MVAPSLPVVLVHGAWHGGWSWSGLQHALDGLGVASYAIDLPGRGLSVTQSAGLAGDVRSLSAALDQLDRRVVLVGHSYGGAVVSEVGGRHPNVASIAFVAAFALESGESVNGFLRAAPRHPVRVGEAMRPQPDGSILLDPDVAADLFAFAGSDEATITAQVARLCAQPAGTFTDTLGADPFDRVPTTYVLCEDDEIVHPAHQEIMAARCTATVRLRGGHFPMHQSTADLAAVVATLAREAVA